MSVLSKALTVTVLATVFSGCAANFSNSTGNTSNPTGRGGERSAAEAARSDADPVLDAAVTGDQGAGTPGTLTSADNSEINAAPERIVSASAATDLKVKESRKLFSQGSLGIDVERGNGFSRILLKTKGDRAYDVQSFQAPARLVLDLLGEKATSASAVDVGKDPFVKGIRLGAHNDRTRVVLDLTSIGADEAQVERIVDQKGGKISITFVERNSNSSLTAAPKLPAKADSQETAQVADAPVMLNAVTFAKIKGSPGQVELALTDEVPFDLAQETPTEYVMTLAGVTATERTRLPQISPAGFPGIRSTRAVQSGDVVKVRMFVDAGVGLVARPAGKNIIIEAAQAGTSSAKSSKARAQVKEDAPPAAAAGEGAIEADEKARSAPTGIASEDGSKLYKGRLISLDLQDTDIDNALRIIAEVSNLNIIASDDVNGKVTLRLIDVPWDQALDVILKTNGLDQVTEGNVVRIAPVDKLRQEREALLEARRAQQALEDLKVSYVRVSYARVPDLKEQVESVLTERGSVSVDERTNQIIVKDVKKGQDEAIALIKKLDLRTPQVLLETEIVEAQRSILRDLGFQWNYSYVQSPETGNATGLVFPNSIGVGGSVTGDAASPAVSFPAVISADAGSAVTAILESADGSRTLVARISALEEEGKVKVISRPQVATINNKQAEIKSVETIRIRLPDSGTSVATGSGASATGGGDSAVEEIEVGITLRVTPQASSDYYVLLDVNAKSSNFGTREVDGIPSTVEREATSTILVKSGQTFALGGVYRINDRDNVQGVPWFKDIPVLGTFFRRTFINKSDEELIFFITPHIVEGSFDPAAMS